jgi:hypothetical protein
MRTPEIRPARGSHRVGKVQRQGPVYSLTDAPTPRFDGMQRLAGVLDEFDAGADLGRGLTNHDREEALGCADRIALMQGASGAARHARNPLPQSNLRRRCSFHQRRLSGPAAELDADGQFAKCALSDLLPVEVQSVSMAGQGQSLIRSGQIRPTTAGHVGPTFRARVESIAFA